MADVRIEGIYNCNVDTVWDKLFFDQDYNQRLYKDALKFPEYEQVKFEETDSQIIRHTEVTPDLGPMPGPLKKVLGDGLGYREEGVFDKKTKRYKIKIIPNKLTDKVTITGEMWMEPAGEGKCNRIFTCTVKAKIFGVGGMLEKKTIEDMQKSYKTGGEFTNEYLKEKDLEGK